MSEKGTDEAKEFSRRLILLCEEFNFEILAQFAKLDTDHSITLTYAPEERSVNLVSLLVNELDCLAALETEALQAAMMIALQALMTRGINREGETITDDRDGRSLLDRLGF